MRKINIRTIAKLADGDGVTLKNQSVIRYKTGWQVATEGIECKTPREVMSAIKSFNGNCGVWFENGIYYVDKCHRVTLKRDALKLGRECNQISIYGWARGNLVYC